MRPRAVSSCPMLLSIPQPARWQWAFTIAATITACPAPAGRTPFLTTMQNTTARLAPTVAPNRRLSGGFSNAAASGNSIDFGDYVGLSAFASKLYAMWGDNANCDGTNPNGTLHQFDLYENPLMLTGGTPSPTPTASPTPTSTPTASPTPTATATATPCVR